MDAFAAVKTLHILSAAVLFGAGMGIAFFMLMAWRAREPAAFAVTARHVVLADLIFTTTAVIVQPLSGFALVWLGGWPPAAAWLVWSYVLYAVAGACWLPVVWIQIRVARLAKPLKDAGDPPSPEIERLMRIWFALGWPAFAAVIGIYFLMVARPAF